jgi:excisionase family DNA binding protein
MSNAALNPEAQAAPKSGAGQQIPDYMTVDDVAARIKASRQFVYKEVEAGRLEADRFGTLVRISPAQFEAYRASQPKKPQKAA